MRKKIRELERLLNYPFKQPQLLITALKHRSYLDDVGEDRLLSNERLEFLGDAVLDLVVSDYFYRLRPSDEEGVLTNIKSAIVSGTALMAQARKMQLGKYLLLSDNEAANGGRDRDSILEDTFEALVGAIYLDGGLDPAQVFIQNFLLADAEKILEQGSLKNYKSMLLEYAQSRGKEPPVYSVLSESGPDHDKLYLVEVRLNEHVQGTGTGRSKKQAEQRAAAEAMKRVHVHANGDVHSPRNGKRPSGISPLS
ncbi:MAG: ribonuclease III [Candidatus Zixiibacteriota bacterium]|nr:MAG: ribonuclease III [candidate division Zixibacteria bacterium]